MTIAPTVEYELPTKNAPTVQPKRRLRLLGEGTHAEQQVMGTADTYDVEEPLLDVIKSYRVAYMMGMYADPEAMRAADVTSMDAPECPCNSTF